MNRFRFFALTALLGVTLVAGAVYAQAPGPGGRGGRGFGPGGAIGIELRDLNLSDAQRQQIRAIMQRYQEQMRAEIMSVLTPEQQEKAKQLQESRRDRRLERQQQRQQP
jgi:Spy/CpxP family protein refolding chaperone